jgi:hypothetical protein
MGPEAGPKGQIYRKQMIILEPEACPLGKISACDSR